MDAIALMKLANQNYENLKSNKYPGRGFVVGKSNDGTRLYIVYWIMGRKPDSRNRVFTQSLEDHEEHGMVTTQVADPSKVKDPSQLPLLVYNAMREFTDSDSGSTVYIVSNGSQTDKVYDNYGADKNESLGLVLCDEKYEPDPNHTPRITALIHIIDDVPLFEMLIIRKAPWSDACERHNFTYDDIAPGFGYCLTTYMGDAPQGEPLPSWQGEPLLMPFLSNDMAEVTEFYWNALDPGNKVALAVKEIPLAVGSSRTIVLNRPENMPTSRT